MKIILIAAMAANRVIGKGNDIPWHIPGEQRRFKEITMGHTLIMGRKTFDSIGRPLPGRRNIIITRQRDYLAEGCEVAHSLSEAIKKCGHAEKVFIAGGEEMYVQALPMADEIYLTTIQREVEGDKYFPDFSTEDFRQTFCETVSQPEPYTFAIFHREKAKSTTPS